MSVLGQRLKTLRKTAKLNQTELAKALNEKYGLNIERAMISKWETGYQVPLLITVTLIADFFNVSLEYLTNEEKTNFGEFSPLVLDPELIDDWYDKDIFDNIDNLGEKDIKRYKSLSSPKISRLKKLYDITADFTNEEFKMLETFIAGIKASRGNK